jgi:hypothetical protein
MDENLPLSICLSVIRICNEPLRGSEEVVVEVLHREMAKIYEQHSSYDDMSLLAAFQSYLIYAMVLFFRVGQDSTSFLREVIMNLQELACSSCRLGLVCLAEERGARPRWEDWIVAEAKRRTLYTMNLLDSLLLTQNGLPTYMSNELKGLLVPGNGPLWEATTRRDWMAKYNILLVNWQGEDLLRIQELWPVPEDFSEAQKAARRRRIDMWLESIDAFGTLIYAITSCTHGA